MPPNPNSTMWARRMAMEQQRLNEQKAESQQAAAIAAQGAQGVQQIREQAFQQGLAEARQAGQMAAYAGQKPPAYGNPRLQTQAQLGAAVVDARLGAERRQQQFRALRDKIEWGAKENIAAQKLAAQYELSKLDKLAQGERDKQTAAYRQLSLQLNRDRLGLEREKASRAGRAETRDEALAQSQLRLNRARELGIIGKDLMGQVTEETAQQHAPVLYGAGQQAAMPIAPPINNITIPPPANIPPSVAAPGVPTQQGTADKQALIEYLRQQLSQE